MIVVGYRDDEQIFIVQNSWGKNWVKNRIIRFVLKLTFFRDEMDIVLYRMHI